MSEIIYLNGERLPTENGAISIHDRGFLLGDGLFETIRADQNNLFMFEQHWARLKNGCDILGIPLPISLETALTQIKILLHTNKLENKSAGIRITLTRGAGPRGLIPPETITPTVVIQCFEIPFKNQASISITHSNIIVNEYSLLRQFKSLNYADSIIARQKALKQGFDDALLYNTKGLLVSATCANIFLVIEGKIFTPPLESGALPGVMRQHIIKTAKQQNIPLLEMNIRQEDCQRAQAAFITNSIIQLTPIHRLENQSLPYAQEICNLLIPQ